MIRLYSRCSFAVYGPMLANLLLCAYVSISRVSLRLFPAGLVRSVESHLTSSSRASTGWRIRKTSRSSFRNTRMEWGNSTLQDSTLHVVVFTVTAGFPQVRLQNFSILSLVWPTCPSLGGNRVDTSMRAVEFAPLVPTVSTSMPFLMVVWRRLSHSGDRLDPVAETG